MNTESQLLETMAMQQGGSDPLHEVAASSEVAPFSPGYVLAHRYQIIERIGKGGFGFVYSARDLELEVTVAIKILRPEMETHLETIRRFKQEIQLARKVTHENVCRIYDVGFYSQGEYRIPFLSMELLEGETLDRRLKEEGALALDDVSRITLQVVRALGAAHAAGIVHADLKPANIMLVPSEAGPRAVVTDFGLASVQTAASEEEEREIVIGTPAYMAPEQVQGENLTPAADYYALGCTLYHLISGELPFRGNSAQETAQLRLEKAPPKLTEVPANWISIVRDLMDPEPESRLASGAELRRRLEGARPRIQIALALLLTLVVGVSVLTYALQSDGPIDYGDFELSLPTDSRTLALYEEGQRSWDEFRVDDAIRIWEGALGEGHEHARIHNGLCRALLARDGKNAHCGDGILQAIRSLPSDESKYYDSLYRQRTNDLTGAARQLHELLRRYPGDLTISRSLAVVQRAAGQAGEALSTMRAAAPKTDAEWVLQQADIGRRLEGMQEYQEAIEIAREALPRAIELKMTRQQVALLSSITESTFNLGDLETSLEYGERALALAREIGAMGFESRALSHLVKIADRQNRFTRVLELMEIRSKRIVQDGESLVAHQTEITRGQLLGMMGQPQKADELFTQKILPSLHREEGPTYWEAYARTSRSGIRRSMGQLDLAIEDCSMGQTVYRVMGNERLEVFAQMTCAEAMLDAGRLEEAEELLAKARIKRSGRKNLKTLLVQNTMMEAELALAKGKVRRAYELASEAVEAYAATTLLMDEVTARELQARVALALPDAALAKSALDPALAVGAADHLSLDLRLRLTALRVQLLTGDREAARQAIDALRLEAEKLGYVIIAKRATEALEAALEVP
jgi:serine/threonine protein kinase/predicted Zn-dependent protease